MKKSPLPLTLSLSLFIMATTLTCSNLFMELDPNREETQQDVKDAVDSLDLDLSPNTSESSISQDFTLPTEGEYGTRITWSVSEDDIIDSATGQVTQPLPDDPRLTGGTVTVSLTATITKDGVSRQKSFTLEVEPLTNIEGDRQVLDITYAGGDNAAGVTSDLTLPDTGTYGSTITWSSSDTGIITDDGEVTRPPFSAPDNPAAPITLTAAITDGSETVTREFSLQVARQEPDDAQAVGAADQLLGDYFNETYDPENTGTLTVREDLPLESEGSYGTTLSWTSSDDTVINDGDPSGTPGTLVRPAPGEEDKTVTLTAEITRGTDPVESTTRELTITVPALAEEEVLEVDADLLEIHYQGGDDLYSISENITLDDGSESAYYGSAITWSSSDPAIITDDGTVTRPPFSAPDNPAAPLTMTALLTYDGESLTKSFTVKVLREEPTPTEAVGAAAALLQPEGPDQVPANILAPADSPESVTEDITLPVTGEYGTAITWSSSNTAYIDDDTGTPGAVTLPAPGEGDQTVTLTGTISSGGEEETITFTLTLREPYADLTVSIDMTDPANPVDSLGGTQPTLNQAAQGGAEIMTVNATEGMDSYTWTLSDGSSDYSDTYPNGTTPFNTGGAEQTVDSALLTPGTSYTLTLWYESGGEWYSADIIFTVTHEEAN